MIPQSVSPQSITPQSVSRAVQQPAIAPDTGSERHVYVANYNNNSIEVFNAGDLHGTPVATITQGVHQPTGIFVDASKTLYVANMYPNTLTEYRDGALVNTIALGNYWRPGWITVDSNGTVYISAFPSRGEASGAVIEYDKGSGTISRTLTLPPYEHVNPGAGPTDAAGMAVDASNNLYLLYGSGCGPCGYGLSMFAPGATSYTQGTNLGPAAGAGGVVYDQALRSVIFGDSGGDIYTVTIPGDVSSHFHVRYGSFGNFIALDSHNGYLYVGAGNGIYGSFAFQKEVLIFDIATQKMIGSLTGFSGTQVNDPTAGIAVDP